MARFVEIDGEEINPEWVVRIGPVAKLRSRADIPAWAKTWVRMAVGEPLYSPLDPPQVKALLEGERRPGAGQGGGPPARVPAAVFAAEEGRSDEALEHVASLRQAWAEGAG
jgi:hypothetical protein